MKICKCCGQPLLPNEVRLDWLNDETLKYIGKRWDKSNDNQWFIWDFTQDENCLPENAVKGKWEDREKLFKTA